MQVPYKWLQQYVEVNLSPQELAEKLTMTGVTVDNIVPLHPGFSGVLTGRIRTVEPHPNADNLLVCQVDVGSSEVQLVTGAPNVYQGQTVAVALAGARLPGGQEIRKATVRGVVSEGMLCSGQELGLDAGLISPEDREGIITLPPDATPGADVAEVLGLDDVALILDLTPNRADCLSIINVAREVAAITGAPLHLPRITIQEDGEPVAGLASVTIEAPNKCARYVARVAQGVTIGPSPLWLQAYLRAAGMRPINNIVDITNFVMLEMGQPLHAFDYDLLQQHRIIVRHPLPGEKIMTLDEVERELDPEMLIIADGAGPVAVAGVMGGFDSEITAKTTRILIESAHFDGASIRRTSRKLGLRSESSLRFERGVNLEGAARAADRAAQLMAELAGGKVAKGRIDCYVRPYRPVTIELRPERVNYLLGTEIAPEKMKELLERLQLEVKVKAPSQAGNEYGDSQSARGDSAAHRSSTPIFSVTIPAYRGDLTQEVDLVEEIARLYGYNRIPVSLPGNITARVKQTPAQRREEAGREAAAASGLAEVITYSFIGPRALDQLQLAADHPWRQTVKIHNPLREEQSLMRPSLLPGLLEVAARNAGRRVMPVAIYELGRVFAPSGELLPHEMLRLGGLVMGSSSRGWSWPAEEMDFFYLKGVLANILDLLQLKDISWEATGEYPFLHPGRAATVKAGETLLGFLGELHPDVQDAVSLPARACVFELDWDVVAGLMQPKSAYQPLPRYPAVERDLAVVVEAETPAAAVSAVIKEAAGEMLTSLTLFDVYQGDPVPAGYKSLAYSLVYQLADRTLTDAEVNASLEQVQKALQQKLAATLRQQ